MIFRSLFYVCLYYQRLLFENCIISVNNLLFVDIHCIFKQYSTKFGVTMIWANQSKLEFRGSKTNNYKMSKYTIFIIKPRQIC